QRALELVKNGGVIKLLSNIIVPEKIVVDKDVRIGGFDMPQVIGTLPGVEPVVDPFNISWGGDAENDFHYLDGNLSTGLVDIAPEHNVEIRNIGFINAEDENGSAIANYQSNLTVYNCNFINNHATGLGAAILSIGNYDINNESKNKKNNEYKVDISNSYFTNNTAPQGSAITNLFSDLYMHESLLYDNNSMSHNSSMIFGMAQVLNISDTVVLPSDADLKDIKSNKIYPAIDLTTIHLNNNSATTTILGWVRPTKEDVNKGYRKGSVNFSFADNYRLKDVQIPVKHLKDEDIDKVVQIPMLFESSVDFSDITSQYSSNAPKPRWAVVIIETGKLTTEAINLLFNYLSGPGFSIHQVPFTKAELEGSERYEEFKKVLEDAGGVFPAAGIAGFLEEYGKGIGITLVVAGVLSILFSLLFAPRYDVDVNEGVEVSINGKTYRNGDDDPITAFVGDTLHMKFNITRDGVNPVIPGEDDGTPIRDGEYSFEICEDDDESNSDEVKVSFKDGVGELDYKIPHTFTKDLKIKFKGQDHDFTVNSVKYEYSDETVLMNANFVDDHVGVFIDEVNYDNSTAYIGDNQTIRFKVNDHKTPFYPKFIKDGVYDVRVGDKDLKMEFKDGWGEYNYIVDKPTTNLKILFKNNFYFDDSVNCTRRYDQVDRDLVVDWKKCSNLSIDNVTLSSPHKEVYVGDTVNVSFHVVNNDMNNSSISDGRYNVSVGGSDLSLDFVDGWANYLYKVNQPTNNLAIVFKENLEANDTQSVYLSVNKTVSNVNWIDRPFKNTQLNILNGDNISLDDNGGVLLRFNVSTEEGKSVRDGVYRVDVFYFVDSSSSSISYFDVSFRDGVGECYYVPNVGVDVRLMITFERVPGIYSSSSSGGVSLNVPSFLNFVNGYSFGGWGSKLSKKNMFL
ncbi:MAG: hypothetical protein LBT66_08915, partial [Methanobrevibacter sp.]|nr:hypothetical protein [Candidatus Methanovirga meridionalis]